MAFRTEQVYGIMYQAAEAEDNTAHEVSEKISRLEYENRDLRVKSCNFCPAVPDGVQPRVSADSEKEQLLSNK